MRTGTPDRLTNPRRWRDALRPISWLEHFLNRLWSRSRGERSPLERKVEPKRSAARALPEAPLSAEPSGTAIPPVGEVLTTPGYITAVPQQATPTASQPVIQYSARQAYAAPQQPNSSYHPPVSSSAAHSSALPVGSDLTIYLPAKKSMEGLDSARVASRRIKAGSNDFLDAMEERRAETEKRSGQFQYDQQRRQ